MPHDSPAFLVAPPLVCYPPKERSDINEINVKTKFLVCYFPLPPFLDPWQTASPMVSPARCGLATGRDRGSGGSQALQTSSRDLEPDTHRPGRTRRSNRSPQAQCTTRGAVADTNWEGYEPKISTLRQILQGYFEMILMIGDSNDGLNCGQWCIMWNHG